MDKLFQINDIKLRLYSLNCLHLSPTEKTALQLFQMPKPYFNMYLEVFTVFDNFIIRWIAHIKCLMMKDIRMEEI